MNPIKDPICTDEPSRPNDKPDDMLKMPPKNLARMFLSGDLYSIFFSNNALVWGSPLPDVVGNFLTIRCIMFKKKMVKRNKIMYFKIANNVS